VVAYACNPRLRQKDSLGYIVRLRKKEKEGRKKEKEGRKEEKGRKREKSSLCIYESLYFAAV
jgi:hypothetical protein